MGGHGSGSGFRISRTRTKVFVEERKYITASTFSFKQMEQVSRGEASLLAHGIAAEVHPTHLLIIHKIGKEKMTVQIEFAQTKTHFGHSRYWLKCPNAGCGRRYGKLYLHYLPDGMPVFVCRKCLKLVYASQNKSSLDRMLDKKSALADKLGGHLHEVDKKPKGMHWKTFYRMKEQLEVLDNAILLGGIAKYGC